MYDTTAVPNVAASVSYVAHHPVSSPDAHRREEVFPLCNGCHISPCNGCLGTTLDHCLHVPTCTNHCLHVPTCTDHCLHTNLHRPLSTCSQTTVYILLTCTDHCLHVPTCTDHCLHTNLHIQQVQLHWIIGIDVLVCKEELLPQSEHSSLVHQALFPEGPRWVQPRHCSERTTHYTQ